MLSSRSTSSPPARLSRSLDARSRAQAAHGPALYLAKMAMITVCGFPCSGKSTRAAQLAHFLDAKLADPACPPKHRARKVVVLNDESLGISKRSYDGPSLPLSPFLLASPSSNRQLTSSLWPQSRRPRREARPRHPLQRSPAQPRSRRHRHRRRHELHQGRALPDVLRGARGRRQDLHRASLLPLHPAPCALADARRSARSSSSRRRQISARSATPLEQARPPTLPQRARRLLYSLSNLNVLILDLLLRARSLDNLISRFEEPNSAARWDAPLVTVAMDDPSLDARQAGAADDGEGEWTEAAQQVWRAITEGELKPPNLATQSVRLALSASCDAERIPAPPSQSADRSALTLPRM